MKHKTFYLGCDCIGCTHVLRVVKYQDGEYQFDMMLSPYLPWYKRLVLGLRYTFGVGFDVSHYAEIWTKDASGIIEFLQGDVV